MTGEGFTYEQARRMADDLRARGVEPLADWGPLLVGQWLERILAERRQQLADLLGETPPPEDRAD